MMLWKVTHLLKRGLLIFRMFWARDACQQCSFQNCLMSINNNGTSTSSPASISIGVGSVWFQNVKASTKSTGYPWLSKKTRFFFKSPRTCKISYFLCLLWTIKIYKRADIIYYICIWRTCIVIYSYIFSYIYNYILI